MKKIVLMGSLTVFVMIMIGFILGFYLMGYKSPALAFFEKTVSGNDITSGDFDVGGFLNGIKEAVLSPFGLGMGAIVVLFSLVSAFTGGGATAGATSFISFLIPILILFAVANIFFFPIVSYIGSEGVSNLNPLDLIIAAILNIFLMLTVVEFISGRN